MEKEAGSPYENQEGGIVIFEKAGSPYEKETGSSYFKKKAGFVMCGN